MLCPISLCIGTYLIKLTDKMITIFPIKITFIFIGVIGTVISFLLSGINMKTIKEAVKIEINPLDMIIGCGDKFVHLVSKFGWASFFRILLNLIIPGSGTLTLLCKYGCNICLFLTSVIQFFGGVFFFENIYIYINGECNSELYEKLFMDVLETTQKNPNDYTYFITVFNYFYTMGLCFYLSGFFLIITLDYIPKIYELEEYASAISYFFLAALTGGAGYVLYFRAFLEYFKFYKWTNELVGLLILSVGGFVTFGGFFYVLFFWEIASKACKIAFPISYFAVVGSNIIKEFKYYASI